MRVCCPRGPPKGGTTNGELSSGAFFGFGIFWLGGGFGGVAGVEALFQIVEGFFEVVVLFFQVEDFGAEGLEFVSGGTGGAELFEGAGGGASFGKVLATGGEVLEDSGGAIIAERSEGRDCGELQALAGVGGEFQEKIIGSVLLRSILQVAS